MGTRYDLNFKSEQDVPVNVRCTACGSSMMIRTNRENGSRFLGCTEFPECRETQPLPASVVMREAGATELPGFET